MTIYKEGRSTYEAGDFEEALKLLSKASHSSDEELAANAYFYMAECHIELGDIKNAEIDAQHMMLKDPYYTVAEAEYPILYTIMQKMRKRSATIVTASQQAESIDESPVPVTLITRAMIDASGATNLQELLLQFVPGMSKIEGVEPNIAMRGTYSHTQEDILIMLDGHRLNSYATNVEAPDYRTSLDKIDHIEVLRGPASSLYGNVALTSAVNIITRRGNEVNGNHISVQYGSNNTVGVNMMRGKGGFRNEYLAWASLYRSEGEKVNYDDRGQTLQKGMARINSYRHFPSFDAGARIRWDDVTLAGSIQHSKRTPYENLMQYGTYTYNRYEYDHSTKPGTSRMTINLNADYNHTWDKFTLSASVLGNYERSTLYNVIADTINSYVADVLVSACNLIGKAEPKTNGIWQTMSWQTYSFDANVSGAYSYSLGNQNGTLMGGIQFNYFTLAQGTFTLGYDYKYIQYTTNTIFDDGNECTASAFFQLKHCFSKNLIFNGGARYDHKLRYDKEQISMLSPRLSLIWLMNKNNTIKASYAQSFVDAPFIYRACQVEFFTGSLRPQKMNTFQLGFNSNLPESNLKWEINGFYNICHDLVIIGGRLADSGPNSYIIEGSAFSNSGKANIGGIEGIITYEKPSTLATLNLTYQHEFLYEENDSITFNYITNVPEFLANLTLAQKILKTKKWGDLWFRASAHMQSAVYNNKFGMLIKMILRPENGEEDLDFLNEYQHFKCIANAGIEWRIKKLRLGFDVYNIFNTHYDVSSRTNCPQPQQSRHFLAKASFDF